MFSLIFVGMAYLKDQTPGGFEPLIDYFDSTYVSGTARAIRRGVNNDPNGIAPLVVRRVEPQFPPETWNVFDITLNVQDRTNNLCESWNYGFSQLIGHNHPSVWVLLDGLQKDSILVSTALDQDALGQPPRKRVKQATRSLQNTLLNLCKARRDGSKSLQEQLSAVSHTIRYV